MREDIRSSLRLLSPRDRRLFGLAVAIEMATSLLDILGVALLGMVGLLAVSVVNNHPPPGRLGGAISKLGGQMSDSTLIAVLTGLSAALLIARNVLSPLLLARTLKFLARREAAVSTRLTRELLRQPLTFVQQRSSQQTAAALLDGTNWAISVVLGQAAVVAAEAALLTLLAIGLMLVNPLVALGVVGYLALVGAGLNRVMGHRAAQLGAERKHNVIASLTAVQEAVGSYREITVADRRHFYTERIHQLRSDSARIGADLRMVGMLPKYVSEAALVVGAFALAAVLFTSRPVAVAAGTFAIFLAAATRLMPSLLRLQSALTNIRSGAASAQPTYQLADELGVSGSPVTAPGDVAVDPAIVAGGRAADFPPWIRLRDVTFTYPGAAKPALAQINLDIREGQFVALVGRSGAGKSTLVDVILGVLQPDSGSVVLGGVAPTEAVRRWPGGIGYVPQDVMLTRDSLRANVALGLPPDAVDDDAVWEALRRAHLDDYVRGRPEGLDAEVGERGLRLSGGQRQRLGIARALLTEPHLVVLDEATSALDSETESAITTMLDELGNGVTTVVIAHRLSTVRHADLVAYLENGHIIATGTFEEVCDRVPALQTQADLMGLGGSTT